MPCNLHGLCLFVLAAWMAGTGTGWWLSIRPVSSTSYLTCMNVSVRGRERTWAVLQGPALFAFPVVTIISWNLFACPMFVPCFTPVTAIQRTQLGTMNEVENGKVTRICSDIVLTLCARWDFDRRCSHLSYMMHFVAYFVVEHVVAFKNPCFSRRFSERALSYFID